MSASGPRKVRFQTSVNESDEDEAMKTFLLFESGHCGHLTLAQFKQAVIELETYDQVICRNTYINF